MKAYEIGGAHEMFYAGTLKEAHDKAKGLVEQGDDWRDIEIKEIEVRTDKSAVIEILNKWSPFTETGRVWQFKSVRLGLEELKPEGEAK